MNKANKTKSKSNCSDIVIEKLRELELALSLSSNLTKTDLKKLKTLIQGSLLKKLQEA